VTSHPVFWFGITMTTEQMMSNAPERYAHASFPGKLSGHDGALPTMKSPTMK